jgi:glycosyltransferase involved in cell wall biosynthesis
MRPLSQTRLHRLLKDFQPDLINLHHPQTMVSYFQSALSRNPLPVITSLHGYDLECFVPEEARTLKAVQFKVVTAAFIRVQQWLQSSTAVVANSQYTATLAQKMNPQAPAPHVIYNALDPARFKGVAKRPDKAPSRYLFAFGRLDKQKGFDLLLEAYAQLANAQSLQLIIAGSGPDQAQYEQYIAEAGLQEKVYLPGRATPKEVVAYLQHADLVVVPSRWEAFGITVLEALAAGKKVVATDVGGIPEFANFPHCHICAPTAAALAQAIPKALAQEMKPTQKEAQQKEIWSKFNEEVYLQKFSAVIEKVVS